MKSSREVSVLGDEVKVYDKSNLSTLERIARIKDDVLVINSFLDDYQAEHFTKDQLTLLKSTLSAISINLQSGIQKVDLKVQMHQGANLEPLTIWRKIYNFILFRSERNRVKPVQPITCWNTGVMEMRPDVIKALKKD